MSTHLKTLRTIVIYLAFIFSVMVLLWSCTIERGCPGAGRENGYTGYDGGGYHAKHLTSRKSY